ncbi:MAG: M1 family metallopeptidase [Candidatus Velamenicoccus archaeovorus]
MDDAHRLPRTVTPSRYDLTLDTDLDAGAFSGSEDVTVRVHEPVDEIVLNALELQIDAAWLEDGGGRRVEVRKVDLDEIAERATLALDEPVHPGTWTLHLEFRGVLNDLLRGYYRSTYTDEAGTHVIGTTHFEATDARRAFPCWDEPDLKAVFGITLIVREGLTALSNGPEISREPAGDGKVRIRFADTMVMSTYLVAFVVGRLELTEPVDVDGVPLRIAHVPGKGHLTGFALEIGAFALRFFAEYYGIPYPDAKVDFVALPDFGAGAMENLGCITYREALLLVDPGQATQPELLNVADVVAHELAHMWFGDLVTMRWWNGIWLNEAFATFMANLTVDAFKPEWERWASFRRSISAALEIDGLDSTRSIEYPVHSPDDASDMFDTLTYTKGAAVLRMLEQYLGADRFREGIRLYLARHAHGSTETEDLWDAIEEGTGEPVRRIMDSWIWQGGYPVVTAERTDQALALSQERFRYLGGDDGTRWEVPLLVRFGAPGVVPTPVLVPHQAGTGQGTAAVSWWDADAGPAEVVVNAGGSSFVRVRYEAGLRDALIAAMPDGLTAIERFGLVDDAWATVMAGLSDVGGFLTLVQGFAGETDLHVWQALIHGLAWLDRIAEGEVRERLRAFVRDLVGPALGRLGWDPAADEPDLTRALRGSLAGALAVLGDDAEAGERLRALEARARGGEPVDAALASAAVGVTAATGGADEYEAYLERRDTAPTPQEQLRYLYALPDFRDEGLLDRTLELAMTDAVRTQNAHALLARAIANRDLGERAWRFVRDRWDQIVRRLPPNTVIYVADPVRLLTTPELEAEVQAFFAEHDIPQARKMLRQVLERQRVNGAFRRRAEAELAAALGP